MPIRATPPITMQQVLTEFAAPQATPLSAMLKGGYYVPSNVSGGTIPVALPLDLSDFLGAVRPASVTIDSVTAVAGSVSSTISGLTTAVSLTHASVGPRDTTATANATARVNFKLVRATTPKVRLAPQAGNAVVSGIFRRLYGSASRPTFDNGVPAETETGPLVTDTAGAKQGSWTVQPLGLGAGVGLSEPQRIADALVLSNAAVDGSIVSADFRVTHTIHAYIGEAQNFNDVFTHNAAGGRAAFQMALLFLDNDDNLVQEVPVSITVATFGQLSAFATVFTP